MLPRESNIHLWSAKWNATVFYYKTEQNARPADSSILSFVEPIQVPFSILTPNGPAWNILLLLGAAFSNAGQLTGRWARSNPVHGIAPVSSWWPKRRRYEPTMICCTCRSLTWGKGRNQGEEKMGSCLLHWFNSHSGEPSSKHRFCSLKKLNLWK